MRLIFTFILSAVFFNTFSFGLGDWSHETPGANLIMDPGDGNYLRLKNGTEIHDLKLWYFYKDYIIATTYDDYIIVDERTGQVNRFATEYGWNDYIGQHNLKPFIWTRWYSENWVDYDILIIWLIFLFYISIPIIILFLWILYQSMRYEYFNIQKPYTKIVLIVVLTLGTVVILDFYPQSFLYWNHG
jgi:amino acid transporter